MLDRDTAIHLVAGGWVHLFSTSALARASVRALAHAGVLDPAPASRPWLALGLSGVFLRRARLTWARSRSSAIDLIAFPRLCGICAHIGWKATARQFFWVTSIGPIGSIAIVWEAALCSVRDLWQLCESICKRFSCYRSIWASCYFSKYSYLLFLSSWYFNVCTLIWYVYIT